MIYILIHGTTPAPLLRRGGRGGSLRTGCAEAAHEPAAVEHADQRPGGGVGGRVAESKHPSSKTHRRGARFSGEGTYDTGCREGGSGRGQGRRTRDAGPIASGLHKLGDFEFAPPLDTALPRAVR